LSESNGGTIGGGSSNHVFEDFGTISGGNNNSISDNDAVTTASAFMVIGGGTSNQARSYGTVIGGGQGNIASGFVSTISGGIDNQTYDNFGVVAGGTTNKAGSDNADVFDGAFASVGGGQFNIASGKFSTVAGGESNAAQGEHSAIPGGANNVAFGQFSLAAGRRAHALNNGSFVWADSVNGDFSSTADNQFIVRANGGVGINKSNPAAGTLDVSGDIALSGSLKGAVARTATTAGLRIVRGVVDGTAGGAGAILEGDGFLCVRNSTGDYTITYFTPFKAGSFPSVAGTAFGATAFPIIGSSVNTAVNIQFKDAAGAAIDPTFFHFIAIGL
jgi:hypothetical protein